MVLALAALLAVVVFLPGEGRVAGPLHEIVAMMLGQAAFMLPSALFVVGSVLLVRSVRPDMDLPRQRLIGLGLLALAVLAIEDAGRVGNWLYGSLVDWLGGLATWIVLGAALILGAVLTFEVGIADLVRAATIMRTSRRGTVVHPEEPDAAG